VQRFDCVLSLPEISVFPLVMASAIGLLDLTLQPFSSLSLAMNQTSK